MSAMEDVGFELRQCGYWIFSTGFPKSLDASKALDQHFGLKDQREIICERDYSYIDSDRPSKKSVHSIRRDDTLNIGGFIGSKIPITEPVHKIAKKYQGYGTALKPATEIIAIGRKPMIGTLAENLLEWGCGAMNLDACRVGTDVITSNGEAALSLQKKCLEHGIRKYEKGLPGANIQASTHIGRFPPHLLHDGSEIVKKCFPDTGGNRQERVGKRGGRGFGMFDHEKSANEIGTWPSDNGGSASRFFPSLPYDEEDCATIFYCAKASRTDRNEGCEMIESKSVENRNTFSSLPDLRMDHEQQGLPSRNHHVSVKPTNLMRWLCRLLTPKGGTLLDPFMGSGSTLKAAVLENFTCIGIEMDEDYFAIAEARVAHVSSEVYVTPSRPERAEVAPRQQRMF
jgi:site-specific DNA-methyltransferase (adenine-specific)